MNEFIKEIFIVLISLIKCIYQYTIDLFKRKFSDKKLLDNDIALITGAASGIGRELCMLLAPNVKKLIAVDINKSGLETLASNILDEYGVSIETYYCDLRIDENIKEMQKFLLKKYKRVTLLICNAGVWFANSFLSGTNESFLDTVKVNFTSQAILIREFLPNMLGNKISHYPKCKNRSITLNAPPKGHIVVISSIAGHIPAPMLGDYCSSKAGSILLLECLRAELKLANLHENISTTNVMPFLIDTKLFDTCRALLPNIFPVLKKERVAKRIFEAIQRNEEEVFIGKYVNLLPIIKHCLPTRLLTIIYEFCGLRVDTIMTNW